jgi:hypothetical protein
MPLSIDNIEIILTYIGIFFGIVCFFSGMIGVPLSIILYITFPKKIKEEFFETNPDKTARWGFDSYMAYYAFPGMVSMVTVVKAWKKVYSNHYDFKEKLSRRRISFFRFHFYIAAVALTSGIIGISCMIIVEVLEVLPNFFYTLNNE